MIIGQIFTAHAQNWLFRGE